MAHVKVSDLAAAGVLEAYEKFLGSKRASSSRAMETFLYNVAGRLLDGKLGSTLQPYMMVVSTGNVSAGLVAVADSMVRQGQGWKSAGIDGVKVALASFLADASLKQAGIQDKALL